MKLSIRNMVCERCKMVVKDIFEKENIHPHSVDLGEVVLSSPISGTQLDSIGSKLKQVGFSIINDRQSQLIEQIKKQIILLVHQQGNLLKTNLSNHLSKALGHDYHYLSSLFSEKEGTTIEKYYIAQKIEKAKELLVYGELTLSEIANQLQYSSVAHLSNQFKKVTGLSASHFKNIRSDKRKSIDEV